MTERLSCVKVQGAGGERCSRKPVPLILQLELRLHFRRGATFSGAAAAFHHAPTAL